MFSRENDPRISRPYGKSCSESELQYSQLIIQAILYIKYMTYCPLTIWKHLSFMGKPYSCETIYWIAPLLPLVTLWMRWYSLLAWWSWQCLMNIIQAVVYRAIIDIFFSEATDQGNMILPHRNHFMSPWDHIGVGWNPSYKEHWGNSLVCFRYLNQSKCDIVSPCNKQ